MSLLLLDFVTEKTVTEVTICTVFSVVLLQSVIFLFTDLYYILSALSLVNIHKQLLEKLSAERSFYNAKGNRSVGAFFK